MYKVYKENHFDTIVIGLGAMGSASVYQLAKRGNRVLGIDQFVPPHTFGSTHGSMRVTRQAIGEYEQYTPLSLRTLQIFKEIEKQTGKHLLGVTGYLAISNHSQDGSPLVNNIPDVFKTTLAAAKKYNIEHEILNTNEIRQRFPQFKVQNNEIAYYEPGGGFLRPEACVEAQLSLAKDYQATINTDEKVTSFIEHTEGVFVRTNKDEYHAKRLVISAGPWIKELINLELAPIFTISKQIDLWYDVSNSFSDFVCGQFPTFIWEVQGGAKTIYGFPAIDGPNGGVKIGIEYYENDVLPDSVNRQVNTEYTDLMYETQVAPFIPKLEKKCIRSSVCLCTLTPDSGFIIDKHPQMPSVIICSPCSGHGFKHSAAIGELIAELVVDKKTNLDISGLRFSRFANFS